MLKNFPVSRWTFVASHLYCDSLENVETAGAPPKDTSHLLAYCVKT
jgi:hypothetical protein